MSNSRYSSKARGGRNPKSGALANTAIERQALFSTEDLAKSRSGSPAVGLGGFEPVDRVESYEPYEAYGRSSKSQRYSVHAAEAAALEAQSDETLDAMKYKVGALRDLSVAMGEQITRSRHSLAELGDDMGLSSERITWTMGRMRRFVESSGVGWRVWAGFSLVVLWLFVWVWLF